MRSMSHLRRGFTLIEVMVVIPFAILLVGGLIAAAIGATSASLRSYGKTRLQSDVLAALDTMEQDARISLNIKVTSTNELVMEALATDKNPLDNARSLVNSTSCAPMTTVVSIADATTYKLSYKYDSATSSLSRTGDFTGSWCGGTQATQGDKVWQQHNQPEKIIQDAEVTMALSDFNVIDSSALLASAVKVTLTATRIVGGEDITYTDSLYIRSANIGG